MEASFQKDKFIEMWEWMVIQEDRGRRSNLTIDGIMGDKEERCGGNREENYQLCFWYFRHSKSCYREMHQKTENKEN